MDIPAAPTDRPSTNSATTEPATLPAWTWPRGVFHGVVQQGGSQAVGVHLPVGEDVRHRQRVGDVRLAALAHLAFVGVAAEVKRLPDQRQVIRLHIGARRSATGRPRWPPVRRSRSVRSSLLTARLCSFARCAVGLSRDGDQAFPADVAIGHFTQRQHGGLSCRLPPAGWRQRPVGGRDRWRPGSGRSGWGCVSRQSSMVMRAMGVFSSA